MTERSKTLLSGVAALLKSAVLLAGVPLALSRLWLLVPGGRAPTALAAWHGAALWGHAVLVVVAAIWLAAAVSLGRDLVRALNGRLVTPTASWSSRWASRVAGLALLVSAGSAIGSSVASAATVPVRALAPAAIAALAHTRTGSELQQPSVYVVRAGDCLSSIAASELGDAGDWPQLARLNMGRLQPDGRRLTDPSLIYPGWHIELPDRSAQSASPAAVPPATPHPDAVRANSHPDVPGATPRPVTDRHRPAKGSVISAPAVAAGPTAAAVSKTETIAARPAARPAVNLGDEPRGDASTAAASPDALQAQSANTGTGPTRRLEELAVLGVGLLGTAAVARRVRLLGRLGECLRRPGERMSPPEPAVGRAIAAVDPLADTALIDWVDAANHLLWRACSELPEDADLPEVRVVRAGPDGVELRLTRPLADAPSGFVALEDGIVWALDASLGMSELAAMTEGCGRYVPALVPVGDAEDATYLVALGPGQRLALDATDVDTVGPDLATILVGLRTLPWSGELQVELVGLDAPVASERCYRLNSSSASELAELALTASPERRQRLSSTWSSSTLVVVGESSAPGLDEDLLAHIGRVAGIIAVGGPATVRLRIGAGGMVLEPDGIALGRSAPSRDQLALVEAMLVAAASEPRPAVGVEAAALPVAIATPPSAGAVGAPRGPTPAGPVEVRVLARTPSVEGWASPPSTKDRSRVVEVVGYLALHGHEATTDRIRDGVFSRGERTASLGRVHNVCSATRSALGAAADGRSYMPASAGGRYRLDSSVTCDWTRFEQMRAAALLVEPEPAIALLVDALSLLDGVPLADVTSGWEWVLAEGLHATIVSSAVDCAHHLATLATARGDARLARWALDRGRSVEPWSEILARDSMVVADLDSDLDSVRRTWRELELALDNLDGNEPSPETRALYEELTAATARASRQDPAGDPYRSARNG